MSINLLKCCVLFFVFLSAITWAPVLTAAEKNDFITRVNEHYKNTLGINIFALSHHYLNKPSRGSNYWDAEMPNRLMSYRRVEIDLAKKHFYDNDVHYFAGGRLIDRVQFQNDTQSYFYERNGSTLGKRAIKQSMNRFDGAMGYFVMNLDFIAIRPLLEEANLNAKVSYEYNEHQNSVTLTHLNSAAKRVRY